jgi:hypothetical protein
MFFFKGVQDMRGFSAQTDRNGFIETANSIYQKCVELDSLRFGITKFAVGAQVGQILLLECFCGLDWVCLNGEARVAGDEAKHSEGNVFRFSESFRHKNFASQDEGFQGRF